MAYPQAIIETDKGTITVELWDDVAPNHVKNMLDLGAKGFYDGLGFHRILDNFVI
ncbi:MAG: peptidylprolyl isomerase, partial [Phycisphaeraceae bacterium]|nr:peptidylprolyl isomerase [Phycisphaeraceae bacterium]